MPTDFECAALALDVYRDKTRPTLLSGWRIYLDYKPGPDDKGYFGACYIKETNIPGIGEFPTDIVFAHRGTVLSIDDLIADLAIAMGNAPAQYANAKSFYDTTIDKLKSDFPGYEIEGQVSFVGHSLGSIITEIMCAATFGDSPGYTKRSVSFESPGSKPVIETMVKAKSLPENALTVAKENCYIVQTHCDVINSCNEQVGDVYSVDVPFHYDVMGGPITIVPSEYYLNYYYITGYSFSDQHKIQHIYEYLSQEGSVSLAGQWPFGFENGYTAYKHLSLKSYWDGYIKICWNTHPEIQEAYQGKYDKYHTFFVNEYLGEFKSTQQLAKQTELL